MRINYDLDPTILLSIKVFIGDEDKKMHAIVTYCLVVVFHSFHNWLIIFFSHPGYFGKVGMRYFHLTRNKYHCPTINLDKLWSLVSEQTRENYKKKTDGPVPVIDVVRAVSIVKWLVTKVSNAVNWYYHLQSTVNHDQSYVFFSFIFGDVWARKVMFCNYSCWRLLG